MTNGHAPGTRFRVSSQTLDTGRDARWAARGGDGGRRLFAGCGGYGGGRKIGRETQALLYKDPASIADLDKSFDLARLTAESANPRHGADDVGRRQGGLLLTSPIAGGATQIGTAALSKFLHSKIGVRLLTKGLRLPAGSPAAATVYARELARFAAGARVPLRAPAVADESEGAMGTQQRFVDASKLTPRQARFVSEYSIDLNATQAAIGAGFSAKARESASLTPVVEC
jgi:hypothetical protein